MTRLGTRSISRFPRAVGGAIGAGEDDFVAVGVTQPNFPMVGATVLVGWIAMAWQEDFGFQFQNTGVGGVEIVHFKPQQHAVADRQFGIANGAVMMIDLPVVQLKNEPPVRHQPFIVWAAMGALAVEQSLIPAAAGFDIADADERLWAHG